MESQESIGEAQRSSEVDIYSPLNLPSRLLHLDRYKSQPTPKRIHLQTKFLRKAIVCGKQRDSDPLQHSYPSDRQSQTSSVKILDEVVIAEQARKPRVGCIVAGFAGMSCDNSLQRKEREWWRSLRYE